MITERVLMAAVINSVDEAMMLRLLNEKPMITPGLVEEAFEACKSSREWAAEYPYSIWPPLMEKDPAKAAIFLLLDHEKKIKIKITEDMLMIAVTKIQDERLIKRLLADDEVTITDKVLIAAFAACSSFTRLPAGSPWHWDFFIKDNEDPSITVLMILLNHRKSIKLTERVLVAAVINVLDKELMKLLLAASEGNLTYMDIEIPTANPDQNIPFMLLDRSKETPLITRKVMKAAVQNEHYMNENLSAEIATLLLDRSEQPTLITKKVLKAATQSRSRGPGKTRSFLDRSEQMHRITEATLKAAEQNQHRGDEIVRLLLARITQIPLITSDVMKAAVQMERGDTQTVPVHPGEGSQVIHLSVRNFYDGTIPLNLETNLLIRCPTEDIVTAAVGSGIISVLRELQDQVDGKDWADDMIQQLSTEGFDYHPAATNGRIALSHTGECEFLHSWILPTPNRGEAKALRHVMAVEVGFRSWARFPLEKGADTAEFWSGYSPDDVGWSDHNGTVKSIKEWVKKEDEINSLISVIV